MTLPSENRTSYPNIPGEGKWWGGKSPTLGVFEGGGQKGIMYAGALLGMLDRGLWFHGVAGSSAGAITAAFVAAGLTPPQVKRLASKAKEHMLFPTTWNLLSRVRRGTGALNHYDLREWLRKELADACKERWALSSEDPTFGELFGCSKIELHVVAVDLKSQQLAVFNHRLTSQCSVANAVMASATIPFAFESPLFAAPVGADPNARTTNGGLRFRAFVDGGIAANFPVFVFRDTGFRKYAKLDPLPKDIPVVGFLLREPNESQKQALEVYRTGNFVGTTTEISVLAKKVGRSYQEQYKFRPRKLGSPQWKEILSATSRPIRTIWRAIERILIGCVGWFVGTMTNHPYRDTLGEPKDARKKRWVSALKKIFLIAPGWILFGSLAYGAAFVIGFITLVLQLLLPIGSTILAAWNQADFFQAFLISIVGILVVGSMIVSIFLGVLGALSFFISVHVYRTVASIGGPLSATFIQTPQAPPWIDYGPETVIRLPIPVGVSTLKMTLHDSELEAAIEAARSRTADVLAEKGLGAETEKQPLL